MPSLLQLLSLLSQSSRVALFAQVELSDRSKLKLALALGQAMTMKLALALALSHPSPRSDWHY